MKSNKKQESPLRYIAYVRKSEEAKERQELSHAQQIEKIKETFPELNIVHWMEPESGSAFHPGRSIFSEMLQMIDDGKADGIVAWHPNRLARNEIDSAKITYLLRAKPYKLKDLKFCIYRFENSPEGILMLQNLMSQAQYESSSKGRDSQRGMAMKAQYGERPGPVPQGYVKVPVFDDYGEIRLHNKKPLKVTRNDDERFDMVARMWKMFLSGVYTPSQIRRIANQEWKFTTRKTKKLGGAPLTQSMMHSIFNNIFYAGYITHNGETFKGNHEPMITLEEFDYAQMLLGKRGKHRHNSYVYAYASLIRCGECSCMINAKTNIKHVKSLNARKVYVHYYCTRKSEARPCTQAKYTSVEKLESDIETELKKYTILPEFRDLALKVLRRNNKIEVKERTQIYESQQRRRRDIQAQLDKLIDMRSRELLDDEEYMSKRNALKGELLRIDDMLRQTENRAEKWLKLTEEVFDFATYASIHFKNTKDKMVKRHILMTLGANFTLKDQTLTLTPNEWLIPIAESYPAIEKAYLNVRTNKNSTSTDREMLFDKIFQSWYPELDSNQRP